MPVQDAHIPNCDRTEDYRRRFHRLLRKSRGPVRAVLGVPLTGMIDVVFNLLIFFVVITTASQREGFLAGKLPAESADQAGLEIPALPIRISVFAADRFDACHVELEGLQQAPDSFDDLYEVLSAMHVDRQGLYESDNPVILSLAPGVSVDQMVKTYNAVVLAGFSNIQFFRR